MGRRCGIVALLLLALLSGTALQYVPEGGYGDLLFVSSLMLLIGSLIGLVWIVTEEHRTH
jgi:hypothetical protein